MPEPFIPLSIGQFQKTLNAYNFSAPKLEVHVHHTWRPNHAQDRGWESIVGMYRYHVNERGWSDIAQHVTVDSTGVIWTGRDWGRNPASARGHNAGVFMFEMIGDFDSDRDILENDQLLSSVKVTAAVLKRFRLGIESVRFHNEFSDKSCPGTTVNQGEFIELVTSLLEDTLSSYPAESTTGQLEMERFDAMSVIKVLQSLPARLQFPDEGGIECGTESQL